MSLYRYMLICRKYFTWLILVLLCLPFTQSCSAIPEKAPPHDTIYVPPMTANDIIPSRPGIYFFFSIFCNCHSLINEVNNLYPSLVNNGYELYGVIYGPTPEHAKIVAGSWGIRFPVYTQGENMFRKVSPHFEVRDNSGLTKDIFLDVESLRRYALSPSVLTDSGQLGLRELVVSIQSYVGKVVETSGRLEQTSKSYFPSPVFVITNGVDRLRVTPWLPLERAPRPQASTGKKEENTMSSMIGKNVKVRGKIMKDDSGSYLMNVESGRKN